MKEVKPPRITFEVTEQQKIRANNCISWGKAHYIYSALTDMMCDLIEQVGLENVLLAIGSDHLRFKLCIEENDDDTERPKKKHNSDVKRRSTRGTSEGKAK